MRLRDGEVHVWWARRGEASPMLEDLLDEVERARRNSYVHAADRDRFVVGCALSKLALAQYLDVAAADIRLSRTCSRCGGPHAKPRLVSPATDRLELSVSHAGDRVVVAVTPHTPVGVDVEQVDRLLAIDELASSVLTHNELCQLNALAPSRRQRGFLVWWTRKEASVKATGAGLELPLRRVVVSPPGENPQLLAWPHHIEPEHVTLADLNAGDAYVAALAVCCAQAAVKELNGSTLLHGTRRP
jgi:4'-phosphopantetheinyl transferase